MLAISVPHATRSGRRMTAPTAASLRSATCRSRSPRCPPTLQAAVVRSSSRTRASRSGVAYRAAPRSRPNPGSGLLRPIHRLGQEVRPGGGGLWRHRAVVDHTEFDNAYFKAKRRCTCATSATTTIDTSIALIDMITMATMATISTCPRASKGRAQPVFRRSTGGAELHGRGRALRHGSQAPVDRQPLGYGSGWLAPTPYPPWPGGTACAHGLPPATMAADANWRPTTPSS